MYHRSTMMIAKRIATNNSKSSGLRCNNKHFNFSTTNKLTPEERDAAVRHANKEMKGYTQTRISRRDYYHQRIDKNQRNIEVQM